MHVHIRLKAHSLTQCSDFFFQAALATPILCQSLTQSQSLSVQAAKNKAKMEKAAKEAKKKQAAQDKAVKEAV